jgi:RNA polymerase sigma factor (sigma-70 family)
MAVSLLPPTRICEGTENLVRSSPAVQLTRHELQLIYAYVYSRVRNRMDAEDLTQQVALKAIPRLRADAERPAVRSYLFATARSALAAFWASRLGLPQEELRDDLCHDVGERGPVPTAAARARVRRILANLPARHARLLELRFLMGYSLKEAAEELRTTVAAAKSLQVRALRAASRVAAHE